MITVEPTEDMTLVNYIIKSDDIWERAADEGIKKDDFAPSCNNMCRWLLCKQKDKNIGVILVHVDNSFSIKIHPYLYNKFRFLGREVMNKLYEWFLSLPRS